MSSTVNTTWFSSAATSIVSAPPADAIRPSSWSVRAGTFASSAPLSSESSLVSLTPSRYESVATMRRSLPLAVTGNPGDRVDERRGGHRDAAVGRRLGQLREVLGRERAQVELRGTRHHLHVLLRAAVLERQVILRQRTDDVEQKPAGDDRLAGRGFRRV